MPLEFPAPPAPPTTPGPVLEPARMEPKWRWTLRGFFVIFAATMASIGYFASQRVPLARCLDHTRSSLVALPPPGDGVEARVMVLRASEGQVRARHEPPERSGQPHRLIVEWSASTSTAARGTEPERLLTVPLPWLEELDVIDTRGPFPERMPLKLERPPLASPAPDVPK